jgi:predicted ArsR family transcriptional regulator
MRTNTAEKKWLAGLLFLSKRKKPISVIEFSEETGITEWAARSLLRRLQAWGCLRLAGFKEAQGETGGRRQHLYELTSRGRDKVAFHAPSGRRVAAN